jgi:hypothetical protein
MDNQNEFQGGIRERSNGRNDEEIWGAKDSLRRNVGLHKTSANDEITPLLDSGNGSPEDDAEDDGEDRTVTEWAGHADFEGLSWRHKPSVRMPHTRS